MSESAHWIQSQEDPSDEIVEVCQQLFGKGDAPVQMDKIHGVQRQLHSEAKKRDKANLRSLEEECEGRLYFMVDNPCKQGCPDTAPHMNLETGQCGEEEGAGTLRCDRESVQSMKLPSLRLYAQCIEGVDASSPTHTVEFSRSTGGAAAQKKTKPARAGGDAGDSKKKKMKKKAKGHPQKATAKHTEAAAGRGERSAGGAAAAPGGPAPSYHTRLMCDRCTNGHGPCINPTTGVCAPYDVNGVAPNGFVPCKPVPCLDVRAPCYKIDSDYDRPACAPKDPLACRQTDPSGTLCTAHACPPGHIENTSLGWQTSFYQDPQDRTKGLWRQELTVPEMNHMAQALPLPGRQDFPAPGGYVSSGGWRWKSPAALS